MLIRLEAYDFFSPVATHGHVCYNNKAFSGGA